MKHRSFFTTGINGILVLLMGRLFAAKRAYYPPNIQPSTDMNHRLKPFDVPHKALRNALSQLSLLAGNTDYSEPGAISTMYQLGKEVLLLLNTHANDENEVNLKHLETKVPGASHHDIREHEQLHIMQLELEKMLDRINEEIRGTNGTIDLPEKFYSSLTDFHSVYLAHMAEEERVTQRMMWENFSDEELAAQRAEIIKSLPAETLLLWFKYAAPALTHTERINLFGGFRKAAPAELFERTKNVLKKVLEPGKFEKLMESI